MIGARSSWGLQLLWAALGSGLNATSTAREATQEGHVQQADMQEEEENSSSNISSSMDCTKRE